MAGPPSGTPHQPFQPFSEVTGVVMSRPAQPCAVHTGWEAWSPGSHVMVLWLYSVWKATRMCSWLPSDYTPGTAWTCTHPRPDKEAPSLSCVFQLQPSLALSPPHLHGWGLDCLQVQLLDRATAPFPCQGVPAGCPLPAGMASSSLLLTDVGLCTICGTVNHQIWTWRILIG